MKINMKNKIFDIFSKEDYPIIFFIFSKVDDYIYIDRKIIVSEDDLLYYLEKEKTFEDKRWLRNKLVELSSIKVKETNSEYLFFQSISINIENKENCIYSLCLGEGVYNKLFIENEV